MMNRIAILLLAFILSACGSFQQADNEGTITIFHAGSLSYPLREVIRAFNEEYPEIRVLTESSGSVAAARKITELYRICDIFASADYKVIEELLYPDHANWHICFARNEMSIVFTEKSRYSEEINSINWPEILLRENVRFGRSDPDADPCGYRTLLTWQLAETYYQLPGMYEKLLPKDTRFIRPKEVDLLALLETNTIDYIFLYRSVAEQHGLRYLVLPDSINLGNPLLSEHYRSVSVEVGGTAPGKTFTFYGEPMVYAVTIPFGAPNSRHAELFLRFLLNPEKGLRIMEDNGQPAVDPLIISAKENLPESLSGMIKTH